MNERVEREILGGRRDISHNKKVLQIYREKSDSKSEGIRIRDKDRIEESDSRCSL